MRRDRRSGSLRRGWRWWCGWLAAAAVVVGLTTYFVVVGAARANVLGGPIGAVIALVR